jgi:hypothetical protein
MNFKEKISNLINKYETKPEISQGLNYTMRQRFIDDYY